MYIGPARNMDEIVVARELATRIFSRIAEKNAVEYLPYKVFLWEDVTGLQPEHVVILSTTPGRVEGVVRLVPRVLFRQAQGFSCIGFTSICIDSQFRGRGLSLPLMNAAILQAKQLGGHVGLLIGRRAVDHYYTRFDFWGASSYSKLHIPSQQLNRYFTSELSLREMNSNDLISCNQWYESAYKNCFGRFARSESHWRYLSRKAAYHNIAMRMVLSRGKEIGYVMYSAKGVHEIALASKTQALPVLAVVGSQLGQDEMMVEIAQGHQIFSALEDIDASLTIRQCSYGGHMVRILDAEFMMGKMAQRVRQHAKQKGMASCKECLDGILLRWDGEKAYAQIQEGRNRDALLGYGTTMRLLGATTLTGQQGFLDDTQPFNISLLDQF